MMMSRLKQATLPQHHEAEALMPVLDPSLTDTDYARLLRQLHGVIQPLEARLLALPIPAPFELDLRVKAPLLIRDLATLPGTRPVTITPPPLPGVPEALGALYVLEGATLGGQIITRHLRQTLGVTPQRGGAYFYGYGPATGTMWRAFGDAMNRLVAPGDEAQVIAGAQATFETFANALREVAA